MNQKLLLVIIPIIFISFKVFLLSFKLVALTEGRGEARHEVGLAAICVSKPLLILCQISDSQNYINTLTKINIFDPNEVSTLSKFY